MVRVINRYLSCFLVVQSEHRMTLSVTQSAQAVWVCHKGGLLIGPALYAIVW